MTSRGKFELQSPENMQLQQGSATQPWWIPNVANHQGNASFLAAVRAHTYIPRLFVSSVGLDTEPTTLGLRSVGSRLLPEPRFERATSRSRVLCLYHSASWPQPQYESLFLCLWLSLSVCLSVCLFISLPLSILIHKTIIYMQLISTGEFCFEDIK